MPAGLHNLDTIIDEMSKVQRFIFKMSDILMRRDICYVREWLWEKIMTLRAAHHELCIKTVR